MPTLMVSAEGVSIRRRGNGKPKILVRGRRRSQLQKAISTLQSLLNQEDLENRRAALNNYNPYFIFGPSNGKTRVALEKVQEAMQTALAAKA